MIHYLKTYSIAIIILMALGCRKGIRLEETPVSIKKISEIGEFVCAEYYGEVVESLSSIETGEDYKRFRNYYSGIRRALLNEYAKTNQKHKTTKRLRIAVNKCKKNNKELLKQETTWQLQKISYRYDIYEFLSLEIYPNNWESFYTKYKSRIDKKLAKELKGTELVYIGRGWVKAGFDFKNYDFDTYAKLQNDTLYLRNLNPVILDADINPWFAQDEIKGFEIIKMEKERKIELSQIARVKARCKYKLKQQAIQRDILNYSIVSARETLEGLFALLKLEGDQMITTVIIEPTEYFYFLNDIVSDGIVDIAESENVRKRFSERYFSVQKDMLNASDSLRCNTEAKQMLDEIYLYTVGNDNSTDWELLYDSLKLQTKK